MPVLWFTNHMMSTPYRRGYESAASRGARYVDTVSRQAIERIGSGHSGLSGIRSYFDHLIAAMLDGKRRWGCLITNSVAELALHDPDVAARVKPAILLTDTNVLTRFSASIDRGGLRVIAAKLTKSASSRTIMRARAITSTSCHGFRVPDHEVIKRFELHRHALNGRNSRRASPHDAPKNCGVRPHRLGHGLGRHWSPRLSHVEQDVEHP